MHGLKFNMYTLCSMLGYFPILIFHHNKYEEKNDLLKNIINSSSSFLINYLIL